MKDQVTILGKEYMILFRKWDEDPKFKRLNCNGYCESYTRKIVIGDLKTFNDYDMFDDQELAAITKQIVRHEVTHAYFAESGLKECANPSQSWADNEEMVDWIANKGEQIFRTWKELGVTEEETHE